MLLLGDNGGHAIRSVVRKRLGRVLEQPLSLARLARQLRRWQINQPLGIGRKSAHHLQRRSGVLLPGRDVSVEACSDQALAAYIVDVQ